MRERATCSAELMMVSLMMRTEAVALATPLISAATLLACGSARPRRDDLDRLAQALARILPDEIHQRLGAEPIDEDRLVLAQHADVEKFARGLDRDQKVDRRAGKAGDRLEVDGLEGEGDHLVAVVALPENRPDRQGRVAFADGEGLGKQRLHRFAVERRGLRRPAAQSSRRRQKRRRRLVRNAARPPMQRTAQRTHEMLRRPAKKQPVSLAFSSPGNRLCYAENIAYSTFAQLPEGGLGDPSRKPQRRRKGHDNGRARKMPRSKIGGSDFVQMGERRPDRAEGVIIASTSASSAEAAAKEIAASHRPRQLAGTEAGRRPGRPDLFRLRQLRHGALRQRNPCRPARRADFRLHHRRRIVARRLGLPFRGRARLPAPSISISSRI